MRDRLGITYLNGDVPTAFGHEHHYDPVGRLTQRLALTVAGTCEDRQETGHDCTAPGVQRSTFVANTYTYDLVGNRTDQGGAVQAGDRLTAFAGLTLEHDADGNLTHKGGSGVNETYYWNSLGQLDSVRANGALVSYAYDGAGRRVRKTSGGVTRQYLWDGDDLAAELDGSGAVVAEYTYYPGVDSPLSVRRGGASGAMYYYPQDLSGNVIGLLDATGQVVDGYQYDPWGVLEGQTEGVPNPLKFQGREHNAEAGLYYFRARYYDPALGRFVSEDPLGLAGGINPYAFAGNDAVNVGDPSGLSSCYHFWGWINEYEDERLVSHHTTYDFIDCAPDPSGGGGGRGGPGQSVQQQRSCPLHLTSAQKAAAADVTRRVRAGAARGHVVETGAWNFPDGTFTRVPSTTATFWTLGLAAVPAPKGAVSLVHCHPTYGRGDTNYGGSATGIRATPVIRDCSGSSPFRRTRCQWLAWAGPSSHARNRRFI